MQASLALVAQKTTTNQSTSATVIILASNVMEEGSLAKGWLEQQPAFISRSPQRGPLDSGPPVMPCKQIATVQQSGGETIWYAPMHMNTHAQGMHTCTHASMRAGLIQHWNPRTLGSSSSAMKVLVYN